MRQVRIDSAQPITDRHDQQCGGQSAGQPRRCSPDVAQPGPPPRSHEQRPGTGQGYVPRPDLVVPFESPRQQGQHRGVKYDRPDCDGRPAAGQECADPQGDLGQRDRRGQEQRQACDRPRPESLEHPGAGHFEVVRAREFVEAGIEPRCRQRTAGHQQTSRQAARSPQQTGERDHLGLNPALVGDDRPAEQERVEGQSHWRPPENHREGGEQRQRHVDLPDCRERYQWRQLPDLPDPPGQEDRGSLGCHQHAPPDHEPASLVLNDRRSGGERPADVDCAREPHFRQLASARRA